MTKDNLSSASYGIIAFALSLLNENKIKILNIINNKPCSISEIQRTLSNKAYKEIYRWVSELIKDDLVIRTKETKQKHQPVIISITEKGKEVLIFYNKYTPTTNS